MVVKLESDSKCEWPRCKEAGEVVAYGDDFEQIWLLCRCHANLVLNAPGPEYVVDCPNCGCEFGVN